MSIPDIKTDPLINYIINEMGYTWKTLPREIEFETGDSVFRTEIPICIENKIVKVYISDNYARITWEKLYYEIKSKRIIRIENTVFPHVFINYLTGKNLCEFIESSWSSSYKIESIHTGKDEFPFVDMYVTSSSF